jgi:acetyl-CoA synthetase
MMIAPTATQPSMKAGSATKGLPGIAPILLDEQGRELVGEASGVLCFKQSWPGQARTLWNNHARFESGYFAPYPGYYFSGDGARRDADGDFWITGRVDDVLNVAGHRLSTAEIEAAFGAHESVAESAVVGSPHPMKGEGITAYIILKQGFAGDDTLRRALITHIRSTISPIATPDTVYFVAGLPKTRSGKIMRRILRKIAAGEEDLGDISTLADPGVIPLLRQC